MVELIQHARDTLGCPKFPHVGGSGILLQYVSPAPLKLIQMLCSQSGFSNSLAANGWVTLLLDKLENTPLSSDSLPQQVGYNP